MTSRFSYGLICVVFLILPHNSFASEKQLVITPDMQYAYAQQLFEEKDYNTAMVELKRFVYFFPDSKEKEQAQFNIAVCLFQLKQYPQAARAFNEIIKAGKENEITKEAFFYQSQAFMSIGNTGYAEIVLQNYLKLAEDIPTRDRIYFNLAKLHVTEAKKGRQGSLDKARDYLSKMSVSGADKFNADHYLTLIDKAKMAPRKNPRAAGLFAIIPGGGFLYCERYHDAFVTFLLNAGLMFSAYKAWDNDNKPLAGVIAFVETGFYTGNIYGSISSAHKYNLNQTNQILNQDFSITSGFDPVKKGYALSFNYAF